MLKQEFYGGFIYHCDNRDGNEGLGAYVDRGSRTSLSFIISPSLFLYFPLPLVSPLHPTPSPPPPFSFYLFYLCLCFCMAADSHSPPSLSHITVSSGAQRHSGQNCKCSGSVALCGEKDAPLSNALHYSVVRTQ